MEQQTTRKYDAVVIGGGIAGVAAAVSAARMGASTCLIEKSCVPGGLATAGNVVIYLPICDGEGHQVIGGLGEELLRLSVADGYEQIPAVWDTPHSAEERSSERFQVRFNAPSYMLALEELLLSSGVDIWYDTLFCDVEMEDHTIQSVIVQNKSGRIAIPSGAVVDASGDADVCAVCGEETVSLNSNVRSNWFFYHDKQDVHLVGLSESFAPDGSASDSAPRGYSGVVGEDVSAHVIGSHQLLRERFRQVQASSPDACLVNIPTMPSFRMTRRLAGEVTLSEALSGQVPDDLAGLCPSWRQPGIVYGIPFRSLRGKNTRNLLTAGRCISASGRVWDMTRVIPICALTGEIAGTAIGVCLQSGISDMRTLPFHNLRQQLEEQHNILDACWIREK